MSVLRILHSVFYCAMCTPYSVLFSIAEWVVNRTGNFVDPLRHQDGGRHGRLSMDTCSAHTIATVRGKILTTTAELNLPMKAAKMSSLVQRLSSDLPTQSRVWQSHVKRGAC